MGKLVTGKKFIIERILAQAKKGGIALTEIEVRMLDFDEETASERDLETAAIFEREYNDKDYEKKIEQLLRRAYRGGKDGGEQDQWDRALMSLGGEDTYLKVLLSSAQIRDPFFVKSRLWILLGAAPLGLVIIVAIVVAFSPLGAKEIPNESIRLGIYALAIIAIVIVSLRRKVN